MLVVKLIMDILFVVYYLRGRADHFDTMASRLYIEYVVHARIRAFVVSTAVGWVPLDM